jgi:hypothetical protein
MVTISKPTKELIKMNGELINHTSSLWTSLANILEISKASKAAKYNQELIPKKTS